MKLRDGPNAVVGFDEGTAQYSLPCQSVFSPFLVSYLGLTSETSLSDGMGIRCGGMPGHDGKQGHFLIDVGPFVR